jgi:hypothetical protein
MYRSIIKEAHGIQASLSSASCRGNFPPFIRISGGGGGGGGGAPQSFPDLSRIELSTQYLLSDLLLGPRPSDSEKRKLTVLYLT